MATVTVAGETVRATGGHAYWVVRGEALAKRPKPMKFSAYEEGSNVEGRWVLAKHLRVGDVVLLRHLGERMVDAISLEVTRESVYNFSVADLQNYAVGERGVLVHNKNETAGGNGGANGGKPLTPTVGAVGPKTLAELLHGVPDDAYIHLSTATEAELATGVYKNQSWAKFSDVKHLTPHQYRTGVVGNMAEGYSPDAVQFAIKLPESGNPGLFKYDPIPNLANVPEYINPTPVTPDMFRTVPEGPAYPYKGNVYPNTKD